MRSAWALALSAMTAATASGCDSGPSGAGDATDAGISAGTLATQQSTATPVAQTPDPGALAELLSMVPSSRPPATGPDGGTLVGSDTKEPDDDDAPAAAASGPKGRVSAGAPVFQPDLSTPAIERAAREQIYWNLNDKCPGPNGKPLPPDSITLVFTIRTDGTVDPASVAASADETKHEPAADCVLRQFSASPFRGPSATLLTSVRVIITWPSAD